MKFLIKVDQANNVIGWQRTNVSVEGFIEIDDPTDIATILEHNTSTRLVNGHIDYISQAPTNEQLTRHLAEIRWNYEQGGTVWNNLNIRTDDASRSKYVMERYAILDGTRITGSPWKFDHGFENLTNEEFIDLTRTVRSWVLNCFGAEAEVKAMIDAGTITTKQQVEDEMALRLS